MLLGKHLPGKPKIFLYTSSGLPIDSFAVSPPLLRSRHARRDLYEQRGSCTADLPQWDLSPPVLLHFTTTHLLVVSDEGTYRLYDLSNSQSYTQHTLGGEVGEMGVVSAKAYDDGFVVFNGALQFMEVKGWNGARPVPLASSCGSFHRCMGHAVQTNSFRYCFGADAGLSAH